VASRCARAIKLRDNIRAHGKLSRWYWKVTGQLPVMLEPGQSGQQDSNFTQ